MHIFNISKYVAPLKFTLATKCYLYIGGIVLAQHGSSKWSFPWGGGELIYIQWLKFKTLKYFKKDNKNTRKTCGIEVSRISEYEMNKVQFIKQILK